MKQYINVSRLKNKLCVREIVDNVEYRRKVKFKPYLFQRSSKPTEYRDFYDIGYVKKVTFENPYEMREFIELYKDIPNELWGNKDIISQFMYDEKYDCFDFSNIVVSYLDIEVCTRSQNENGDWIDGGFPEASEARFPINAICDYRSNTKKYYTFTTAQGWTKDSSQLKYADEVEYIYCKNEQDLIKKWLTFWVKNTPHITTGWNCIDKNSNIWKSDRIITLTDIKQGDILCDSIVNHKFPMTKKNGYKITLDNGMTIIASKEHIFPIYSKSFNSYTKFTKQTHVDMTVGEIIDDVNHDHYMIVPKHMNINDNLTYRKLFINNIDFFEKNNINVDVNDFTSKETCVIRMNNNSKRDIIVNLDEEIDADIINCLGLVYTDGSFDDKRKCISFYNTDDKLIDYYARVLDNYKDKKHYNYKPKSICECTNKDGRWLTYKSSSNNLFGLLMLMFIYNDEHKKCINTTNLSMLSTKQFFEFFSGCVDGDGSLSDGVVVFCNYTNDDIKNIHELLYWNGVYSSLCNNSILFPKSSNKILKDYLTLHHSNKSILLEELEYSERKNSSSNVIKYRNLEDCYVVHVKSIEDLNDVYEMYDIETSTHYFYANGIKTHNCKLFDIPYIVNRIKILFGNDIACRLSPFNTIESKEVAGGFGNKLSTYEILGVSIIDYLDLYKKYRNVPREKYTLDFISRAENPEEHKLEFKGTHGSLYYDNPRFFVDYNIQDVRCVVCFENKLQLLQLATNLSYFSNINFEDNFSPIKIWETVISKTCLDNNIVIPMRFKTPEKKPYEGAYVHEPVTGLKGCVASFDYTSLYPKIMELFYIGADVHCRNEEKTRLYEGLLKTLENDTSSEAKEMLSEIKMTGIFNEFYMKNDMPKSVTNFLQNNEVSLTTNCEFYKVSRKSIFVSLITKLFNERKSDKKTSFMYKHKAQEIKDELKKRGIILEEKS